MAKKPITVRLEPRTIRLLEEIASDKRIDRSTLAGAILQQYTERYVQRKHEQIKRDNAIRN